MKEENKIATSITTETHLTSKFEIFKLYECEADIKRFVYLAKEETDNYQFKIDIAKAREEVQKRTAYSKSPTWYGGNEEACIKQDTYEQIIDYLTKIKGYHLCEIDQELSNKDTIAYVIPSKEILFLVNRDEEFHIISSDKPKYGLEIIRERMQLKQIIRVEDL